MRPLTRVEWNLAYSVHTKQDHLGICLFSLFVLATLPTFKLCVEFESVEPGVLCVLVTVWPSGPGSLCRNSSCVGFPSLNFDNSGSACPFTGADVEVAVIDVFPALCTMTQGGPSSLVAMLPASCPSPVGRFGKMKSPQKSDNVPVLS